MNYLTVVFILIFCANTIYTQEKIFCINDQSSGGILGYIQDVAVDKEGNIFILDGEDQKIKKYNKKGKLIDEIGGRGKGPGEFLNFNKIVVDKNNYIYISDNGNKRITIYKNGVVKKTLPYNKTIKKFYVIDSTKYIIETVEVKFKKSDIYLKTLLGSYNENLTELNKIDSSIYKSKKRIRINGRLKLIKYPYPNILIWGVIQDEKVVTVHVYNKQINLFSVNGKFINKYIPAIQEKKITYIDKNKYFTNVLYRDDNGHWLKGNPPSWLVENTKFRNIKPYYDEFIINNKNVCVFKINNEKESDKVKYIKVKILNNKIIG